MRATAVERVWSVVQRVVAAIGLVLGAPVLAVVALLVRRELGSPVLFRQQRPGLGGRLFTLYKFRSMAPATSAQQGSKHDQERLSDFGVRLRASSLDELPSLWNVLRGDMSIVGPRPLLPEYLDRYTSEQARRHEVRPGITGLAQVRGRNDLSWADKLALDVTYVQSRTLLLDLKIIALTVRKVVARDGVHAPGSATAPEFWGSGGKGEPA